MAGVASGRTRPDNTNMDTPKIETTYDPLIRRYRAAVVKEGEVLYVAVRSKREAAEHVARQWIAYSYEAVA